MKKEYFLKPIYDSKPSFYNKAVVYEDGDIKKLKSYETIVSIITGDTVEVLAGAHKKALGCTTLRHIKEFLKQNGHKAETKAQIIADYVKEC